MHKKINVKSYGKKFCKNNIFLQYYMQLKIRFFKMVKVKLQQQIKIGQSYSYSDLFSALGLRTAPVRHKPATFPAS